MSTSQAYSSPLHEMKLSQNHANKLMIKNNMQIVELKLSNYSYYYLFYRKTKFLFD